MPPPVPLNHFPYPLSPLNMLEPLKPPDHNTEDLEKSREAWEAAKAIPGPTKDTTSVELIGMAEGAITAEPKALEPGVGSEDKHRCECDTTADRKSTRLNSSHRSLSRMPSSA